MMARDLSGLDGSQNSGGDNSGALRAQRWKRLTFDHDLGPRKQVTDMSAGLD